MVGWVYGILLCSFVVGEVAILEWVPSLKWSKQRIAPTFFSMGEAYIISKSRAMQNFNTIQTYIITFYYLTGVFSYFVQVRFAVQFLSYTVGRRTVCCKVFIGKVKRKPETPKLYNVIKYEVIVFLSLQVQGTTCRRSFYLYYRSVISDSRDRDNKKNTKTKS